MNIPITFENQFVQQLPADPEKENFPRQVANACFSFVTPSQVAKPQLVCVSPEMAEQLNIRHDECFQDWFKSMFSGNLLTETMQPYAMCYGGYQFGHWAGQLGDGRAINLGEVIDNNGCRQTLQLKGAGLTPYSRTADGLAVLRSSVREFLCSEAMFHLGVATTRALSLTLTGEQVMRDMFYDGHAALEPGAVVCRVAPSFIRFGNFQIHAARHEHAVLKQLVDFTIKTQFSHLGEPSSAVYEAWFDEVCVKTADMIVDWMRVGFVHGVMNTDNLSILGLTIDYGPYGWLEAYDPNWTPNTTDAQGKRYSYANQPKIAQWNLFQLANAIANLVGRTEALEKSLADYADYYTQQSQQMYAAKLGLVALQDTSIDETSDNTNINDIKLLEDLLTVLTLAETDMTIFFRQLATIQKDGDYSDEALLQVVKNAYYASGKAKRDQAKIETDTDTDTDTESKQAMVMWLRRYQHRISQQALSDFDRKTAMDLVNPKFVLRNYLAQQAIDKATEGDFSEIEKLLKIMKAPYDEQSENHDYAKKRPEWARVKAGCSMLSCSS